MEKLLFTETREITFAPMTLLGDGNRIYTIENHIPTEPVIRYATVIDNFPKILKMFDNEIICKLILQITYNNKPVKKLNFYYYQTISFYPNNYNWWESKPTRYGRCNYYLHNNTINQNRIILFKTGFILTKSPYKSLIRFKELNTFNLVLKYYENIE